MRSARLIALMLPALVPQAAPAAAQEPEIVVNGVAARTEIERILEADNVDTSRLSARQTADTIVAIRQGRAPDDFWAAYRAHVEAWVRLADTETALSARPVPRPEDKVALAIAEAAIESSFDEVERIARLYGARLPTPRWRS